VDSISIFYDISEADLKTEFVTEFYISSVAALSGSENRVSCEQQWLQKQVLSCMTTKPRLEISETHIQQINLGVTLERGLYASSSGHQRD